MDCFPGAEALNVSAYGSKCVNFPGMSQNLYGNAGPKGVERWGGLTVLMVVVVGIIGGLVV